MDNITIRPATQRDFSLVMLLHHKFNNQLGYFAGVTARRMIECGQVYIASHNSDPCGYVAFRTRLKTDPRFAAIYQAAVHWDLMRLGHGRALLTAVAQTAAQDGCHAVQLWCRSGDPGHWFWPACGMTAVALRSGRDTARGRDSVLWRAPIDADGRTAVTQITSPRKPITLSGKWARIDAPHTHAIIEPLPLAVPPRLLPHTAIEFTVPADPMQTRSLST